MIGATVTVPTLVIVVPFCLMVGLACWFVTDWLFKRYLTPFFMGRIYRRYVRNIERINAEHGTNYEPTPYSHFAALDGDQNSDGKGVDDAPAS